jgi:hypothetical protein
MVGERNKRLVALVGQDVVRGVTRGGRRADTIGVGGGKAVCAVS